MPDLPLEVWFNLGEAWLWESIALGLAIGTRHNATPDARIGRWTAAVLIPFGLSDLVECVTGNWWTPWWLFVWKALCVIGLCACAGAYMRLHPRPVNEES